MTLIKSNEREIDSIYHDIADTSGLLNVFFHRSHLDGSPYWAGTDDSVPFVMHGSVSIGTNSPEEETALKLHLNDASDLLALEGVFSDYVEYDKNIRAGCDPKKITSTFCRSGSSLSFRLIACPPQTDDTTLKRCYPEETLVNSLDIGAMANDTFIPVASLGLYKGRYSGLCMAHDLAVLKAIMEGLPVDKMNMLFKLNKMRLLKQDYDLVCDGSQGAFVFVRVPKNRNDDRFLS